MNITEDVIERFFTGTCNEEEMEKVARYFKDYPMEADKYFPDIDWDDASKWNEPLDGNVSSEIFHKIHAAIAKKKNQRRALYYKICSIAAIFLLFVGVSEITHKKVILETTIAPSHQVVIQSNTSTIKEHLILPDSTLVELYPNSSVSYLNNFDSTKRDVRLKGEAVFKVYKDALRPFTVYSEEVSTTALGTRFRVKTSSSEINIRLYEGKVVVKKIDGLTKELFKDNSKYVIEKRSSIYDKEGYKRYYLNAGNEIVYHILSNKFSSIVSFLAPENIKASLVVNKSNKSLSSSIILNNQPLSSALDLLAEKFNVQIQYSPVDVHDINIIATISPKQDIDQVLQNIAIMNNLRVNKVDSQKFIITSLTK